MKWFRNVSAALFSLMHIVLGRMSPLFVFSHCSLSHPLTNLQHCEITHGAPPSHHRSGEFTPVSVETSGSACPHIRRDM